MTASQLISRAGKMSRLIVTKPLGAMVACFFICRNSQDNGKSAGMTAAESLRQTMSEGGEGGDVKSREFAFQKGIFVVIMHAACPAFPVIQQQTLPVKSYLTPLFAITPYAW